MQWHLTLDRVVRVQALAGDIVLCSWARHFTLTVPLSTQVHKWVSYLPVYNTHFFPTKTALKIEMRIIHMESIVLDVCPS